MADRESGKKRLIFYTREYRKMEIKKKNMFVFLLFGLLPVVLAILFFYEPVTLGLARWAGNVASQVLGIEWELQSSDYIPHFGDVHFAVIDAGYPSYRFALISVVASLLGVIILPQVSTGWRPLMIYLTVGMWVMLVSSLFFLLVPEYFPYRMRDYSELYIKQQISLWLMIAVSSGMAVTLLLSPLLAKFVCFACTMLYAFVFGCIRYAVFIVVLNVGTLMMMAPLFFVFGVLFDFLQMIAIYAVFVRYVSAWIDSGQRKGTWKWS